MLEGTATSRGRQLRLIFLFVFVTASVNLWGGYNNSFINTAWESFRSFYFETYGSPSPQHGHPFETTTAPTTASYELWWQLTVNVFFPGFVLGLLVSPVVADRWGRKYTMLLGNLLGATASLLSLVALALHLPYFFTVLRFCGAFSNSLAFAALILFLTETSPPELAGIASCISECVYVGGNLVGMVVGVPEVMGRSVLCVGALALLLSLLGLPFCLWLPESPRFLLRQRRDSEAAASSSLFYYGDSSNIEKTVLSEEEEEAREEGEGPLRSHLSFLFCGMGGGLALLLTTAYWPLLYLSTDLLQSLGVSPLVSRAGSLLFISCDFLGTLIGSAIIHRVPRRALLLGSGLLNQGSLVAYTVCAFLYKDESSAWLNGCFVALALYGLSYGCAVGPIAYFLPAELVPQRRRALLTGVSIGVNSAICALLSFFTLPVSRHLGSLTLAVLFVAPCSLCLLFLFLFQPETPPPVVESSREKGAVSPAISSFAHE